MPAPYRDDTDALTLRLTALLEQLEATRAQTRGLLELAEEEKKIEKEIAGIRLQLEHATAGRRVSLVDDAKVASPCPADWDSMVGDDRTRFCAKCEKNVHSLAGMTREEAEAFLAGVVGEVCLRIYRRADGTVMTSDCSVGVTRKRRRLALVGAAVGGVVSAGAFLAMPQVQPRITEMGKMASNAPTAEWTTPTSLPEAQAPEIHVTGGAAPPPNYDNQIAYQNQEIARLLGQRAKAADPAARQAIEDRIRQARAVLTSIQQAKRASTGR